MSEIISWLSTIPLKNTIITGLITSGTTYLFTTFKMKKERKIEYEKSVGSKIAASLFATRDVIKEADVIEMYDFDNSFRNMANNSELNDFAIYPAILNDRTTLLNFWEKINDLRQNHELYLSFTSSTYLLHISRYLTKLLSFLDQFEEIDYHLVGAILIVDIQKWERSFDKHLVKEINKNQLKLTSKTGKKWERKKKQINDEYWEKSILKIMLVTIEADSKDINEQIYDFMVNLSEE